MTSSFFTSLAGFKAMKRLFNKTQTAFCVYALSVFCAHAQTDRYVWQGSPGPSAPYTGWDTAAHDIQAAIDASAAGDTVWVTNGVYNTGGRLAVGIVLTNRVVIDKAITVRSVNGPSNTVIEGLRVGGDNGIRCVYMTNNATLMGFSVINGGRGASSSGTAGGIWCSGPNCGISNTVIGCVVTNCIGWWGAGVKGGTLFDCEIRGNNAVNGGGGAIECTAYNCTFARNYGDGRGGATVSTLYNCTLANNSCGLYQGGGAWGSVLYNCMVISNRSTSPGGGAYNCTLYNCALINNTAISSDATRFGQGGGAYGGALYNCTVAFNTAAGTGVDNGWGGGVYGGTVVNGIVFHNTAVQTASSNYWGATNFSFSCTAPLPSGNGNINVEPMFRELAGVNCRLARNSPCINAGTNLEHMTDPSVLATNKWLGLDLDGGPRINFPCSTVDMGAYENIPPGMIFTIRGGY